MKCFSSQAHKERIYDVLCGAKTALQVGKSALGVSPVPGLAPVADVLIALIVRVEEGLEELSHEISQLVNAIESTRQKTEARIGQYPADHPRRRVLEDRLQHSLLEYRVDSLRDSRDAGTLKELQAGVASALKYFNASGVHVDPGALANLSVVEDKVDEVKQVVEVLESLPLADASYCASVNTLKGNFLPGTRSKLFLELDAWVEGRTDLSGKPICVLTGGVGTGKSTIASEFARRLDDCGSYGASLSSTRLFFPTVAYQLAYSQNALRKPIVNAAREHLKRGKHQQIKYEGANLVEKPVSQVDGGHPPVFLIVDAVDECTDHTAELVPKLLRILMSCVQHAPFPLRVFLTSRPEHVVEHALSKNTADVHKISLHNLSPSSVTRDISLFLRDRLSQSPPGSALLDKQLPARPRQTARLAQRADGLFVYTRTAMDFLDSYLAQLLDDGAAVPDVPLGPLDDLYLAVLETAFPPVHMELRARVEAVLGMSCADSVSVLYQLRAVVLFDRENERGDEAFRLGHASFPQFLHARLALGCLRVLMSLERNVVRLGDLTVPMGDVPDLAEWVGEHVPPHVRHACVHWGAHLAKAEKAEKAEREKTGDWELGRALGEFAAGRMLAWVETVGYLGRLDVAMGALASARDWQERRGSTRELLDEGRQLVADHHREIEECPDDVYRSAIRQDRCTLVEREFGSALADGDGNPVTFTVL
ncbi:hypothetical protein GSI_08412 [Ganoderma sinense ZZ0214-1]|uniref:Nephrocystin 3-like N-terminal domain-containing protein n=1 Tax=Ganoderma sinense ZZ0214-1 TaxID=1077348 RepID=A0A2G8S6R3_9APHY|nr:hypothetical protein GSI_08412 [Ganoderma sinense ZZ0214-1]